MATAEDAPTTDAVPPASENALDAPAAAEAPSSMPGSDDQDPPSPQGSSSSGDSLSTGEWHPNYYPTPSPAWIANLNLTVVAVDRFDARAVPGRGVCFRLQPVETREVIRLARLLASSAWLGSQFANFASI